MAQAAHVLVVDPDHASARALTQHCAQAGLRAAWSPDGLHALMASRTRRPDLLIVDHSVSDDLILQGRLARSGRERRIPVIVLTRSEPSSPDQGAGESDGYHVARDNNLWQRLWPLMHRILDAELNAAAACRDERPSRGGPTLLVVEDDPHLSRILDLRLRAAGYDVLTAGNGTRGYELAVRESPDAIITDYYMPDACGNFLIARLHAQGLAQQTPILVLTGCDPAAGVGGFSLESELRRLGAAAFLRKPPDFNVLLTELRRLLVSAAEPTAQPPAT
jgi:DNA-binding response OmpR family regulator